MTDLLSHVLQQEGLVNHHAMLLSLKLGVEELVVKNRERTRDFVVSRCVR